MLDGAQVSADIARVRLLYDNILRERYDRVEPRLADLDQLQIIAAGYPDRATFLSALALEPPQATQDLPGGSSKEDDDCLVLSTAHSAKGKEWDAVFVIWAVDGWFPSARCLNSEEETEEERRLMYVALTRPRNYLSVTYPLNAYSSRTRRRVLTGSVVPVHRPWRSRQHAARRLEREQRTGCGRRSSEATASGSSRPPSLPIQRSLVALSDVRADTHPPPQRSERLLRIRLGQPDHASDRALEIPPFLLVNQIEDVEVTGVHAPR